MIVECIPLIGCRFIAKISQSPPKHRLQNLNQTAAFLQNLNLENLDQT